MHKVISEDAHACCAGVLYLGCGACQSAAGLLKALKEFQVVFSNHCLLLNGFPQAEEC